LALERPALAASSMGDQKTTQQISLEEVGNFDQCDFESYMTLSA